MDRKHEVHLVSFQKAEELDVTFHPLKRSLALQISPSAPAYRKIGYLCDLRAVKRIVRQIDPDILHAHWATSYGLMGAFSGCHPFVLSTWGSDVFDFPQKSFLHRKTLQYIMNRSDYVTATSRMLAEETRKYLSPERTVRTIPFGVDIHRFSLKSRRTGQIFTVGIVKKLEKKYGVDFLIKAFSTLFQIDRQARLLIVGDGSEESALRRLCRSLDVEDNVSFVGFIANERVPDYMNQMDVFVVPSVMSSETFGVAAVEAAASGLPVIASNIGGLPEVVLDGETGFLVPPRDPEAIAEKMIQLWKDEKLRVQMGRAARRFVEQNYIWEENAIEMERLYLNAAGQRG